MAMVKLPIGVTESDFDNIEGAVMETVKGRWFLAEYARRLRTQELSHVLSAVTRLESRMAHHDMPPAFRDPEPLARLAGDLGERLRTLSWAMREQDLAPDVCEAILSEASEALRLADALRHQPDVQDAQPEVQDTQPEVHDTPTESMPQLVAAVAPAPVSASPVPEPDGYYAARKVFARVHDLPTHQRVAMFS